jgi:glucokinase
MPELNRPEFDVVLSYASEDRPYVRRVADSLAAHGVSFFYDEFEKTLLWGTELPETFNDIFAGRARFAVAFISAHYVNKPWPMHEGRSILDKALVEHRTYFLPVKLDDSNLPGLRRTVGYVDARSTGPEELANMIADKLVTALVPKPSDASPLVIESPAETQDEIWSKDRDEALARAIGRGRNLHIVMDLGGTKAYVSLMTAEANSLYHKRFATESHNDERRLLDFIRTCIRAPIDRIHNLTGMKLSEAERIIKSIGIAFPGPTDFERGVVLDASNFRIANFPLADKISDAFGIETFIDNDVNLAVSGEAWKGAATGFSNVIGIMIGTGIGGGIIVNGQIYRGRNKTAGEIGHMVLNLDSDTECGCGQYGCFEILASRKAMARELSRRKRAGGSKDRLWAENNLLSNQIAAYYRQGDGDAVAVVNRAAEICGKAVFSLLNLFNPEIIVFNGGFVQQLGEVFLGPVREEADKCMNAVYSLGDKKIPIVLGKLPNPVLFGACKMAVEGSGGKVQRTSEQILSIACADLNENDFSLLREIYRHGRMVPITDHSGSDYTKDKLRLLRNRGLISTETGLSFANSEGVEITRLGRIVIEEFFGSEINGNQTGM